MKGHLRKRGDAWELRAYAGIDPVTKRHKYVTRTFRGGKREAEQELARLVTEVSGGGGTTTDTTVGALLDEWMRLARKELSPATVRGYDWIIGTYIRPTLADVPLSKLRTAQLDRFYLKLREEGGRGGAALSPATVRQVHAILRRALQQGIRWGWIPTNPAAMASPPRVRHPDLTPPDPDSVVQLIQQASVDGDPEMACFLHLATTTGARRGELCGLRWSDVDLDGGAMVIRRAVVEAAHSVVVEKDTKTHAARRIALDAGTVEALSAHREAMSSRAAEREVELAPDGHVFSRDPDGKRPWPPNDVTKAFIRVRRRAGLPEVRLHDLRHFAATRLLAAGVPVRTVSGRLGHANAATTLGVYAHFVEESDRDAAVKLGALINPKSAVQTVIGAASQ